MTVGCHRPQELRVVYHVAVILLVNMSDCLRPVVDEIGASGGEYSSATCVAARWGSDGLWTVGPLTAHVAATQDSFFE